MVLRKFLFTSINKLKVYLSETAFRFTFWFSERNSGSLYTLKGLLETAFRFTLLQACYRPGECSLRRA